MDGPRKARKNTEGGICEIFPRLQFGECVPIPNFFLSVNFRAFRGHPFPDLGLSLVAKIIRRHGGDYEVRKRREGVQDTFILPFAFFAPFVVTSFLEDGIMPSFRNNRTRESVCELRSWALGVRRFIADFGRSAERAACPPPAPPQSKSGDESPHSKEPGVPPKVLFILKDGMIRAAPFPSRNTAHSFSWTPHSRIERTVIPGIDPAEPRVPTGIGRLHDPDRRHASSFVPPRVPCKI